VGSEKGILREDTCPRNVIHSEKCWDIWSNLDRVFRLV